MARVLRGHVADQLTAGVGMGELVAGLNAELTAAESAPLSWLHRPRHGRDEA